MDDQEPSNPLQAAVVTAAEMVADIHLPAPIRKNALKAFDQLCSALIDIPVAYLEGFAQDKRAEHAARAELIKESGRQIANAIEVDPTYAKAAATKFAEKIVRERRSLDKISSIAVAELAQTNTDETQTPNTAPEIESDWINNFEQEAAQKSSDDMQDMFGKILAGEILKPGTFSIKAVKLLGQLDVRSAKMFQKLCSVTITQTVSGHIFDARVPALGGNAGANSLQSYGLNFDVLSTLQEYGLVISDLNSYMDYSSCIALDRKVSLGIGYAGKEYGLVASDPSSAPKQMKIHGVMLTKAGRELMRIVPKIQDTSFTKDLEAYFAKEGFILTPIGVAAT